LECFRKKSPSLKYSCVISKKIIVRTLEARHYSVEIRAKSGIVSAEANKQESKTEEE
jgi:hypothetical protein